MSASSGPRRGVRQRRKLAEVGDPDQLVRFTVHVPARLRAKAHEAAAVANMSASAYFELLLKQLPESPALPDSLPLAESA